MPLFPPLSADLPMPRPRQCAYRSSSVGPGSPDSKLGLEAPLERSLTSPLPIYSLYSKFPEDEPQPKAPSRKPRRQSYPIEPKPKPKKVACRGNRVTPPGGKCVFIRDMTGYPMCVVCRKLMAKSYGTRSVGTQTDPEVHQHTSKYVVLYDRSLVESPMPVDEPAQNRDFAGTASLVLSLVKARKAFWRGVVPTVPEEDEDEADKPEVDSVESAATLPMLKRISSIPLSLISGSPKRENETTSAESESIKSVGTMPIRKRLSSVATSLASFRLGSPFKSPSSPEDSIVSSPCTSASTSPSSSAAELSPRRTTFVSVIPDRLEDDDESIKTTKMRWRTRSVGSLREMLLRRQPSPVRGRSPGPRQVGF